MTMLTPRPGRTNTGEHGNTTRGQIVLGAGRRVLGPAPHFDDAVRAHDAAASGDRFVIVIVRPLFVLLKTT